ncbi:uncharacterized protein TNCV_3156381 [Trichonephila clavipes]|nr:uncharacterized protein TNCV_3156381 [Trichonephila clavipes]
MVANVSDETVLLVDEDSNRLRREKEKEAILKEKEKSVVHEEPTELVYEQNSSRRLKLREKRESLQRDATEPLEAQFQISRISLEETKFHYLVSQLEPKYVENIWDIVNSKSDTKYTDSKNRLLSLFKESENLRIKRLLTGIELGDMKPSQLLQKLKTVATSDISDNLIKTLWLEKLPESIKNILIVSDENLSKLAVMADKISDMTPRTEIFATGKSLDCGEATSSRDQLLLDRIQSLME